MENKLYKSTHILLLIFADLFLIANESALKAVTIYTELPTVVGWL